MRVAVYRGQMSSQVSGTAAALISSHTSNGVQNEACMGDP